VQHDPAAQRCLPDKPDGDFAPVNDYGDLIFSAGVGQHFLQLFTVFLDVDKHGLAAVGCPSLDAEGSGKGSIDNDFLFHYILLGADQQLQELPQPSPAGRLEIILKPDPVSASTKSMQIGLTFSNRSFSTAKVMPCALAVKSFSCGSSRARPREGPPQPSCKRTLIAFCCPFCFSMTLLIMLPAFSVTSNIHPP
jgi:hypothetical protein